MKAKVEGHVNIYKDVNTGVIVNRESTDRSKYRLAKQQARMNQDSQTEIARLSREIDEIKSLLTQLINK